MRNLMLRTALIAGATVALAACGGGNKAVDNSANEVDANAMMGEPTNDMSAMEAAGNATEPLPPVDNGSSDNVLGETEGGDTGGETVETNTPGM